MAATLSPRPADVAMLSTEDNHPSLEVAKAVTDYAPTKGFQIVHSDRHPNGSTNLQGLVANAEARRPQDLFGPAHLQEAIAVGYAAGLVTIDHPGRASALPG